jgi:hypothetical protein
MQYIKLKMEANPKNGLIFVATMFKEGKITEDERNRIKGKE